MSNRSKSELIERISAQVRANQLATDLFDEAASERLGINRTDQRALDLLDQQGPMTAGRLAELNRISPAAMTTVIDRLERKGYARRYADPGDRRRVLVEITPQATRAASKIYGPLGEEALKLMSHYTVAELEVIAEFLDRANELSAKHLDRVHGMK